MEILLCLLILLKLSKLHFCINYSRLKIIWEVNLYEDLSLSQTNYVKKKN